MTSMAFNQNTSEWERKRMENVMRTYQEIMNGPNPLTKEEVRALIAKRPNIYGVLSKWA